jgi:hypothetical protein
MLIGGTAGATSLSPGVLMPASPKPATVNFGTGVLRSVQMTPMLNSGKYGTTVLADHGLGSTEDVNMLINEYERLRHGGGVDLDTFSAKLTCKSIEGTEVSRTLTLTPVKPLTNRVATIGAAIVDACTKWTSAGVCLTKQRQALDGNTILLPRETAMSSSYGVQSNYKVYANLAIGNASSCDYTSDAPSSYLGAVFVNSSYQSTNGYFYPKLWGRLQPATGQDINPYNDRVGHYAGQTMAANGSSAVYWTSGQVAANGQLYPVVLPGSGLYSVPYSEMAGGEVFHGQSGYSDIIKLNDDHGGVTFPIGPFFTSYQSGATGIRSGLLGIKATETPTYTYQISCQSAFNNTRTSLSFKVKIVDFANVPK